MITELRTLVAIAKHGTFARAGERIGLTQTAVSGHIRRLEGKLGYALFERTGRSAVLNAAGLRAVEEAKELIDRFDALGKVSDVKRSLVPLRIGAIASVQATHLAQAIGRFSGLVPGCRLHLTTGVSLTLLDSVDAGELDLALMIRPAFGFSKDLVWRSLAQEEYRLLVHRRLEGRALRQIFEEERFIRYERTSFGGRQVERWLRDVGIPVREWLEIDELEGMFSLVRQGLGVAIAPMSACLMPLPEEVAAIALEPDPFFRDIGVMHRRQQLSRKAEAFLDCLFDETTSGNAQMRAT